MLRPFCLVDGQRKLALHFGLELSRAKIQYAFFLQCVGFAKRRRRSVSTEKSQAVFTQLPVSLILSLALPAVGRARIP